MMIHQVIVFKFLFTYSIELEEQNIPTTGSFGIGH